MIFYLLPISAMSPWRFKVGSAVASTSPFLFSFQIHPEPALGAGNRQRSGKIPKNDWIQAPFHRYDGPQSAPLEELLKQVVQSLLN